ncbi:MAG: protein translocase subunit SecF [Candidatus Berkelbacteria bacterium]|nr:MAG: protein translocase subunit SecF [Candidatus Berkelbacteria bacterium]QQG51423.1 MAG: protein translocase subunit SecF [Candidatus Berkelbacteria bacterium]
MIYRFLGKKKLFWFALSVALMIPGIIALSVWKLPFGIDFRGGAVIELAFEKPVAEGELRTKITGMQQVQGAQIASTGENTYLIKTLPIEQSNYRSLVEELGKSYGKVTEKQFQNVGPSVSKDLTRKAVIAVVLASLLIVMYLAYSFRGVTYPVSSWRFGVVAVVALLHDLVIATGVFSILAHFFHFEVDASFITALLTIMGFSVHDTIVVFDRIRENLSSHRDAGGQNFELIADESLSQTLNRSLATSLTVIFTLTALTVLGGESIRAFVVTLLVGIAIGTYSSIFTATPLLVVWQNRVLRRTSATKI